MGASPPFPGNPARCNKCRYFAVTTLVRCDSQGVEQCQICGLNREDAKQLIDVDWWNDVTNPKANLADEVDRHWEWRAILSVYRNKPYYDAWCVKTEDGKIQAAMILRFGFRSVLELGQAAVHVDRLTTAPRNREWVTDTPLYRGAGTGLLDFAIAQSYFFGLSGRVNLLAVAQQEFYRKRHFVPTSVSADGETVFELPVAAAVARLKSRGYIDG